MIYSGVLTVTMFEVNGEYVTGAKTKMYVPSGGVSVTKS